MIAFFSRRSSLTTIVDQSMHEAMFWSQRHDSLADAFQSLRYESMCDPGKQLDRHIASGIAIASAAIKQAYRVEPYRTQIIAAHWMVRGVIVEMATGEGKSFAALLAAIAMSSLGYGVHLATANDYLAQRDCDRATKVTEQLGLKCGCIASADAPGSDRAAYRCDLTYGTLAGFAFDHLRDHLTLQSSRCSGRITNDHRAKACTRRHRLIVDEIDHCLLDEAATPFVISEAEAWQDRVGTSGNCPYKLARDLVSQMQRGIDYIGDTLTEVRLLPPAIAKVQRTMPRLPLRRPWTDYLLNAIRAATILQRDVDYAIEQSQLQIIDKATGRFAIGRQWQDGLHQAVQSHAGLSVDQELTVAAQSSARQFTALYQQVSGCSGTVMAGAAEFADAYGLKVQAVPERLPSQRKMMEPKFFATQAEKWTAIQSDVIDIHRQQRPILIGTRSIAQSQRLADDLRAAKLEVQLLNGTQDRDEAEVVALAGRRSAITVATDMAGRGTDISIDQQVDSLGGLHVIVSELNASPRVDRQLIGRSARQGQQGSAQVYVAADDELIRKHAPALQQFLLHRFTHRSDRRWLWNEVLKTGDRAERAQRRIRDAMAHVNN